MTEAVFAVRSERPGDEDAVDIVNCRGFGRMSEAHLVRNIREYCPTFDRRYSVVAWAADEAAGHVLFTPVGIRLMGRTVSALLVGPVVVAPEYRRRGVGGAMLRFGHDLGRRDGFELAFLAGIPSYYPRFGYQACYGFGKTTVDQTRLPDPTQDMHPWPVQPADIPWLMERHHAEWDSVDFACVRGSSMGEWTMPGVEALVWRTSDGRRVAYTLGAGGAKLEMLLADDPAMAREALARLRPEEIGLHANGWFARHVLDDAWGAAEATRSDAAMACELREGALQEYIAALGAGQRLPGRSNWILPFVLC
jgi:predicted N-acetyltransferase YhbS